MNPVRTIAEYKPGWKTRNPDPVRVAIDGDRRRDGRSDFAHEETTWQERGCWRKISPSNPGGRRSRPLSSMILQHL
jgi:hypothetical protein